jgi:hypothetical protein
MASKSGAHFAVLRKVNSFFAPEVGPGGQRTACGGGEFIESIPDAADRPGTNASGPDLQC